MSLAAVPDTSTRARVLSQAELRFMGGRNLDSANKAVVGRIGIGSAETRDRRDIVLTWIARYRLFKGAGY